MRKIIITALAVIALSSCCPTFKCTKNTHRDTKALHSWIRLALTGPLSHKKAEISSMTWCMDQLLLIPQYPQKHCKAPGGCWFRVSYEDIVTSIDDNAVPLKPEPIPLMVGNLYDRIDGFQGFEAVACQGSVIYAVVEANPDHHMMGHLLTGIYDSNRVMIDPQKIIPLPPQTTVSNSSYESVTLWNEKVFTFYERNAKQYNEHPHAKVFHGDLTPTAFYDIPAFSFRITDATAVDQQGIFWLINYAYPPKTVQSEYDHDPIVKQWPHMSNDKKFIERLIPMKITDHGIHLAADLKPIELSDGNKPGHNWEALAVMPQKGFLIATDMFPETIVAFVPFEK